MQSAENININSESTTEPLAIPYKLLRNSNPENDNGMSLNEQKQNLNTETNSMFATQIKSHERILIEILHQQGHLIRRQDRYVQALLQTQIQRQMQLEETLMLHQQRPGINAPMQLAMSFQPSITMATLQEDEYVQHTDFRMETNEANMVEECSCLSPLPGEDIHKNKERKCNAFEKTYKEQLATLHEELARLNFAHETEQSALRQQFKTLEHEKQTLINGYEQHIWELKQHHIDEIKKLKIMYENRNRQGEPDRLTFEKSFEEVLDTGAGSKIEILETVARMLKNLCSDVEHLRKDMHVKIGIMKKDRICSMEVRKKKLVLAAKRWQRAKSLASEEQRQLGNLLKSLDKQLCQLTARTLAESCKIHAMDQSHYSETQTSDANADSRQSTSTNTSAYKQHKISQVDFRSEDDHGTSQDDCDSMRVYYSRSFDIETPTDQANQGNSEAAKETNAQDYKYFQNKQTFSNQVDPTTRENKNITKPEEQFEGVEQVFQRKISFLQNCMRKIRESDHNRRCQQERLRREQETMANLRRHIQQQSELVLRTQEPYHVGRSSEDDTDPDVVAEMNVELVDTTDKDDYKESYV